MVSSWWTGRRDALLVEVAQALVFFGADPLDDPGVGELAHSAHALALQYRHSDRGRHVREAGDLMEAAAAELRAADRFRATLLPLVVRHLRHATFLLAQGRSTLRAAPTPVSAPAAAPPATGTANCPSATSSPTATTPTPSIR